MKIKLLFFAAVRELVGQDEVDADIPADICTIQQLSAHLEARYEPLRGRMGSVRLARNEEFAGANDPIAEGDTIALIPPVAGG